VIKKWHQSGEYVPYGEEELADLLCETKRQVHPWIRLNRVVRDIPSQYVTGGVDAPNLRQNVLKMMAARGERCRCIRCREVGDDTKAVESATLVTRPYEGSRAEEFFLSFESGPKETLLGFVRLRLPKARHFIRLPTPTNFPLKDDRKAPGRKGCTDSGSGECMDGECADDECGTVEAEEKEAVDSGIAGAIPFPELDGAALIRELHVYGQLIATKDKKGSSHPQHLGFGRRLMEAAEDIAAWRGYTRIAVIAGIGTRNYYRKLGYEVEGDGGFMIKRISIRHPQRLLRLCLFAAAFLAILMGLAACTAPLHGWVLPAAAGGAECLNPLGGRGMSHQGSAMRRASPWQRVRQVWGSTVGRGRKGRRHAEMASTC
jgi:GNAT superfamily N-acetyltransferase